MRTALKLTRGQVNGARWQVDVAGEDLTAGSAARDPAGTSGPDGRGRTGMGPEPDDRSPRPDDGPRDGGHGVETRRR